ncbi:hypothetical protein [Actinoplanes subglobosus]|uniref:DUF4129 domain-containing protein n=1 Tax=Actinoplanes subglobosus TaxID=1547892 RepID=A0ABV8IUY2_9ACTN
MPVESEARKLTDLAALWSIGEAGAGEVVDAACAALVGGLDSPGLRMLAARTRAEADDDVPALLPVALAELGLPFHPFGADSGREAVARALAGRSLAGELTPRELARRVHQLFGHGLPLVERLADLDDQYDVIEYGDRTPAQIDADVVAEARRICGSPPAPVVG